MRSNLCEGICEKHVVLVHDHLVSKLPTVINDSILMFMCLYDLKMMILMHWNDKLDL